MALYPDAILEEESVTTKNSILKGLELPTYLRGFPGSYYPGNFPY